MRGTLDLPDPVLLSLKVQAAQSGKSFKALLNELVLRVITTQASPAPGGQLLPPGLPVLIRLRRTGFKPASEADRTNNEKSQLDAQLQDDFDKLRNSDFN